MKCKYINDSGNCATKEQPNLCPKSRLKCILSPTCWRIATPKPIKKSDCYGCDNDFYNDKNPHNVKECWSFESAVLMKRKKVSVDQVPPWTQKAGLYPSCYRVKRFVFVEPDRKR